MAPPGKVVELVNNFLRYADSYRGAQYKETEVRTEFIDPFFTALGWDVANVAGEGPSNKDVVLEYTLPGTPSAAKRVPDYNFRIGGEPKFFVEAKKPSVDLKEDNKPALQVRTYGWSAGLPISLLTDFEELSVYECLSPPSAWDRSTTGRRKYFTVHEYLERWDEIEALISRDAVLRGSLEEYATSDAHDVISVDEAFLLEIDTWRRTLAKDLAQQNAGLSQRDLNYAVQQTIDRIVFLRICEDRGIEPLGRLRDIALLTDAAPEESIYQRLINLFHAADRRYNSGLFHFRNEQNRSEGPDTLTPNLVVSDSVLKGMITRLYFPESPYRFSVFPADVLGHVYEQFLGKVIRLDIRHGAVVEDKPEVKKAGGVYYTPTYIVSFMVKDALDRFVEGRTPQQVGGEGKNARPLRLVDPACGSGSFLIEAYQYLLDWYRDRYAEDPSKWTNSRPPRLHKGPGDEWLLTGTERKRILINHIFGVDIDPQAVEVTKLSLLLKVLESESTETIMPSSDVGILSSNEKHLGNNIKRGNSLIGTDFYARQQSSLLDVDEQLLVSTFDWPSAFADVFADGGFDVVIGNPPYLSIDDVWGKGDVRQRYLKDAYPTVYRDKTDILFYFLAKAVEICKGEVAFIVSRAFLEAFKADRLRGFLAENTDLRKLIDFQNFYVFPRVGITTAIVSLSVNEKLSTSEVYRLRGKRLRPPLAEAIEDETLFERVTTPQSALTSEPWSFADETTTDLFRKIDEAGTPVGEILHIGQGMQTGRNSVFGGIEEAVAKQWKLAPEMFFIRARNSDIRRWHIRHSGEVLLYPEQAEHFESLPPVVRDHLHSHEAELKGRAAYKRGNCEWWKYTWPLHKEYYSRPKLYCPYLATTNRFALDEGERYLGLTDTTVLFENDQLEDLRYIMALLNSSLLTYRFRFIAKLKSGGILEYFWNSVTKLPIKRVESGEDRKRHDELVALAIEAEHAARRAQGAQTEQDSEVFSRQLAMTESRVDEIVFDLYEIDQESRNVVLAATRIARELPSPEPLDA
jgi:hypothetical protein